MPYIAPRLLVLFILSLLTLQSYSYTLKNFGMNKPHTLFHLGDRHPVSVNYGIGYWLDNPMS